MKPYTIFRASLQPEPVALASPQIQPQYLPLPAPANPDRHHQGHGDYPPVLPQFHYLGVQPHIRVLPAEGTVAEPLHHLVQFPADPGHLAL